MSELFLHIKDIGNNRYFVSNQGRVFSNHSGWKEISQSTTNGGYIKVRLYTNGKCKNIYVHRLVAKYFVDNPENLPQVDHIDMDKTNNNACNLRWVTTSENISNKFSSGTHKSRKIGCIATNIETDVKIHFDSISDAVQYIVDNYCDYSYDMGKYYYYRYGIVNNWYITKDKE